MVHSENFLQVNMGVYQVDMGKMYKNVVNLDLSPHQHMLPYAFILE